MRVRDLLQSSDGLRLGGGADVRFVRTESERLSTRSGAVDQVDSHDPRASACACAPAARGLRRHPRHRQPDAEAALARALALADAGPPRSGAALSTVARGGRVRDPVERDPFAVPLEDKLAILSGADAALRTEPRRSRLPRRLPRRAGTKAVRLDRGRPLRAGADGVRGRRSAVAVRGEETQVRSYPASHGDRSSRPATSASWRSPGDAPRVRGGGRA